MCVQPLDDRCGRTGVRPVSFSEVEYGAQEGGRKGIRHAFDQIFFIGICDKPKWKQQTGTVVATCLLVIKSNVQCRCNNPPLYVWEPHLIDEHIEHVALMKSTAMLAPWAATCKKLHKHAEKPAGAQHEHKLILREGRSQRPYPSTPPQDFIKRAGQKTTKILLEWPKNTHLEHSTSK